VCPAVTWDFILVHRSTVVQYNTGPCCFSFEFLGSASDRHHCHGWMARNHTFEFSGAKVETTREDYILLTIHNLDVLDVHTPTIPILIPDIVWLASNCKKVFIVITEFTLKLLPGLIHCSTKQKLFPYNGPTLYSGWVLVSSDLNNVVVRCRDSWLRLEPRNFFVLRAAVTHRVRVQKTKAACE